MTVSKLPRSSETRKEDNTPPPHPAKEMKAHGNLWQIPQLPPSLSFHILKMIVIE